MPLSLFCLLAGLAFLHFLTFYKTFLYPRFFSPLRSVPGPPIGHPINGQYRAMIMGEADNLQRKWVKQYGPVVRIVGPVGKEHLIFTKPEALQKILSSDWIDYPRAKFLRDTIKLFIGKGLMTATGNDHKRMRKAMDSAFSIPNIMAQSDMYYGSIERLIDILRTQINLDTENSSGKEVLMYECLSKATLDIICETALGYRSDSQHGLHTELVDAYETMTRTQAGPYIGAFVGLPFVPGAARLMASEWLSKLAYKHRRWFAKFNYTRDLFLVVDSMRRFRKASTEILHKKLQDLAAQASSSGTNRDIMSILARARKVELDYKAGGYAMSDEALISQVLTFLVAGHETTASGLSWTLWLLAKDPKSQLKLRAEVSPLFAVNPRPDYHALKNLQWLDCVIQESLRLMPPTPITFRQATKTDIIDDVLVPKGTLLAIPIRVINTWKETWGNDAEEFNPARWLNPPPAYKSASSLSFLSGPYACIGKKKAIAEMKAILGALIANFQFEPSYAGQVPHPYLFAIMRPKDNMPLRVRMVTGSS